MRHTKEKKKEKRKKTLFDSILIPFIYNFTKCKLIFRVRKQIGGHLKLEEMGSQRYKRKDLKLGMRKIWGMIEMFIILIETVTLRNETSKLIKSCILNI